ncbi:MAG TPA: HPr kinase/phosphatase C-terminal domain-containing protein [Stellaceae bacterium]|jgi:serine kinase of HPr protein (carbohydrate metabolism regulator)|nr:HPr kinase/phosphatase C-terminal domain-containing protein [Stellaceae bacterium]
MILLHGTAIALNGEGILLRGPSGSGKSDLALRLVDGGAKLIADDQTELRDIGGAARLSAPATIAGRIEVRGVGIVVVPHQASAPLRLVVDLEPAATIERLPEPAWFRFFAYDIPLIALAPFEASAPAKLRVALRAVAMRADIADAGQQ